MLVQLLQVLKFRIGFPLRMTFYKHNKRIQLATMSNILKNYLHGHRLLCRLDEYVPTIPTIQSIDSPLSIVAIIDHNWFAKRIISDYTRCMDYTEDVDSLGFTGNIEQ